MLKKIFGHNFRIPGLNILKIRITRYLYEKIKPEMTKLFEYFVLKLTCRRQLGVRHDKDANKLKFLKSHFFV